MDWFMKSLWLLFIPLLLLSLSLSNSVFASFFFFFISLSFLCASDQFSHSVVSDSLWPHGMQHTRLPCPSPTPRACSNTCPLSWWCHPTNSSSVIPFFSHLQSCPASFPMSQFFTSGDQYWSFSFNISPSNEHSGLNSFRIDWLDLLSVQETSPESSPASQFKRINFSTLSLHYGSILTSMHDYWKDRSFDYMDLCQQTIVSAF